MRIPKNLEAPLLVVAIVTVATVLLLAAQTFRPTVVLPASGIHVTLVIAGPDWAINYASNGTRNGTAFLFLLEAARTLHFTLEWSNWSPPYSAVFIEMINGARNGQGGRWWQYWIDGTYADTAADLAVLHDGATVLWRFVPPEGG